MNFTSSADIDRVATTDKVELLCRYCISVFASQLWFTRNRHSNGSDWMKSLFIHLQQLCKRNNPLPSESMNSPETREKRFDSRNQAIHLHYHHRSSCRLHRSFGIDHYSLMLLLLVAVLLMLQHSSPTLPMDSFRRLADFCPVGPAGEENLSKWRTTEIQRFAWILDWIAQWQVVVVRLETKDREWMQRWEVGTMFNELRILCGVVCDRTSDFHCGRLVRISVVLATIPSGYRSERLAFRESWSRRSPTCFSIAMIFSTKLIDVVSGGGWADLRNDIPSLNTLLSSYRHTSIICRINWSFAGFSCDWHKVAW